MVTVRPFFQPINCSGKSWNVIALLITQESVEPSNFGFNVPQMDRFFFAKGTKRGPNLDTIGTQIPTNPSNTPFFTTFQMLGIGYYGGSGFLGSHPAKPKMGRQQDHGLRWKKKARNQPL
jgi:hypothetical protein